VPVLGPGQPPDKKSHATQQEHLPRRPVSVAIHGDLVYVANSGDGGSNYTGFRLGPNGRL
jgi:hypothetical protein